VLGLNNICVQPIITPRFALTCDMEVMRKLGALAKKYDLNIQSHISECQGEMDMIKKVFPEQKNYAEVYDSGDLLNSKCIMAHAVHLADEEVSLFAARGASVAHCPASNTFLSSGLCDVKRFLEAGVKVGLGTDISGGNRVGIFEAVKNALEVSQHLHFVKTQTIVGTGRMQENREKNEKYVPLDYKQAIYLATLGGAEALSLSDKIGNFLVGKEFDALLIETNAEPIVQYQLPAKITETKTPEDILLALVQKFIYVGDDRNIAQVFVNGRPVKK
jgi:guanine deaminase